MKNLTKALGIAGITALSLLSMKSKGQEQDTSKYVPCRVYSSCSLNPILLSSANVEEKGVNVLSIPRFSMFWNMGVNENYDFNRYLGVFSGLNLKNIGLTTIEDNEKLIHRIYTLGASLGFKTGDLKENLFLCLGGGYDLSLNYKQKRFIDGNKKEKFSGGRDRVPSSMPSLFAGLQIGNFGLKVQYFPKNFFNQNFEEKINETTIKPYKNLDAKLFSISLGYDFNF